MHETTMICVTEDKPGRVHNHNPRPLPLPTAHVPECAAPGSWLLARSQAIANEASISRVVSGHQNVQAFFDVFDEADHVYLVFELIAGGELFDHIVAQKDGISEHQASQWIRQLLDALACEPGE